jgi:hypothetical protein
MPDHVAVHTHKSIRDVCVCVCVSKSVRTYVRACVYVCLCVRLCVCMYICIFTHGWIHTYTQYAYTQMRMLKESKPDVLHVSTPGFTYTHTHTRMDTHKHTQMRMLKENKPDVLHVSTPGFLVMISTMYARLLNIPIVMSYHTHLPVYAERYLGFIPFIVEIAWLVSSVCVCVCILPVCMCVCVCVCARARACVYVSVFV